MRFKDYYQTLGVARDAPEAEVKKAYRRLASKYHPDVSKVANAEARFKEVGEAYEVLKDPEKRAAYDRFGKDWKAGQEFRPPPDWNDNIQFSGSGFDGAEGFSDFFETLFGRAGTQRSGSRGDDHHARISIDLEDAYRGGTRVLHLDVPGTDASGRPRTRRQKINVKIPRGIAEGQRIRLPGKGSPGMGTGKHGDLYLDVHFSPHRIFKAEGRDIHLELPVTPWEAALGARIKAPTLGGDVELSIPGGSQSGARLRLRGRGLPGATPGDQFVLLRIVTPPADSPQARAFYEEMAERLPFDPRHVDG